MAKNRKICIDRVLPAKTMENHALTRGRPGGPSRLILPIGKKWINGTEFHVRFMGGTSAQKAIARTQAKWWEDVTNLKFVFDDAPNAQIRITFDPSDGAWSYVGTDCQSIPTNEATMNLGFLDGGTAAHEFGHAIGCAHEHQNPDGGIQWNEPVVLQELSGPPNNWDADMIRHNVLNKYRSDQINGTKFDRDSIMLYFFPDTWTLNGIGTKANDVLSAMDKTFSGKMYPKTGVTPPAATELKVNASTRTAAAIGKFGEEDLFRFTVTTAGRHVIDTRGPTDIVMKLFGPNSVTALIAEDDDSGVDLNARISVNLIPGQYFVQVRHFNRASGVGNYSVKVIRA